MKEDLTSKVLKGEKIYPYMDGKVIKISAVYDLREHFKRIIKDDDIASLLKEKGYKVTNFLKFNNLLWEDIEFLEIIKNYFKAYDKDYTLISDRDGDQIFVARLIDKEERDYTLRLVEAYCNMNREHFFENYIDIFGNKIEFK